MPKNMLQSIQLTNKGVEMYPTKASHISWQNFGNVVFVLNETSDEIHKLDGVASDIWRHIDGCNDASQIATVICEGYHCDHQIVLDDVRRFLLELQEDGLIIGADEKETKKEATVPSSPSDSSDIFQDLVAKSILLRQPYSITWELTTRCNMRCTHCYIADYERPELETSQMMRILEDLRSSGVLFITLTGGEIFLRRDVMDVVARARELGFSLKLFSNAALITSEVAKLLSSLYVREVGVSIYSADDSVHDRITTRKGSLRKSLAGVSHLLDAGVRVTLKCPIMAQNLGTYGSVRGLAMKLGCNFQYASFINVKDNGCVDPTLLRIGKKDLEEVVADHDVVRRNPNPATAETILAAFPCSAVFNGGYIDCQGSVYPCNQFLLKIGDVKEKSFRSIWDGSKELEKLRGIRVLDLPRCRNCELLVYCTRCPGAALLEDGDYLGCSSEAGRIARVCQQRGVFPRQTDTLVFADKKE